METRPNLPQDILDSAVAAWRAASNEESLSASARTALFDDVRGLSEPAQAPFVPGITRAWRWAFLGSVPVVALASVLMVVGDHRPVAEAHLAASKIDGTVVFTLPNGNSDHLLYRSTDPHAFNRSAAVKMARNRYTENATGGPTLVFYRID